MAEDVPRYEITAGDVTVEAVVVQVGGKTIVQPVKPLIVHAGESFTISEGARSVVIGGDGTPDGETGKGES